LGFEFKPSADSEVRGKIYRKVGKYFTLRELINVDKITNAGSWFCFVEQDDTARRKTNMLGC
jgi:hypothetical protein